MLHLQSIGNFLPCYISCADQCIINFIPHFALLPYYQKTGNCSMFFQNEAIISLFIEISMEWFSTEYHKTKAKFIALTNHRAQLGSNHIHLLRSTKWNASLILLRDYAELVSLCKVILWKSHIPVRTQKWPPCLIFAGACHGIVINYVMALLLSMVTACKLVR